MSLGANHLETSYKLIIISCHIIIAGKEKFIPIEKWEDGIFGTFHERCFVV